MTSRTRVKSAKAAETGLPIRAGQAWHPMMAWATHDDLSYQVFVQELMKELTRTFMPGNRVIFERVVKPRFVGTFDRAPRHVSEVRRAMLQEPAVQYWSSIKRIAKELQYEAVGPSVERQLSDLIARSKPKPSDLGMLTLDETVQVPRYNVAVDIHAKPGGYHSDLMADDVFAGAEFDRSFFMVAGGGSISRGGRGPFNDEFGVVVSAWAKSNLSDIKPKRILDMGCTVGNSTLPWVDAFPDAEVFAIDVAAPCLRYAHARAEALGKGVHFMQQSAERTSFEDGSFDLVVSHILLHELSHKGLLNVFRECHRLLRPGGAMLHCEGPPFKDMTLVDQFFIDWQTHYQAEPFLTAEREASLPEVARVAGFHLDETFETRAPGHRGLSQYVFGARKSAGPSTPTAATA